MRVRDRGAMLVLTVLVGLAMTAAVTTALVPVLGALHDHQRARSAADAAALAGVTGGRQASESIAAANGAQLVRWSQAGRSVTVEVVVGAQSASARATDDP